MPKSNRDRIARVIGKLERRFRETVVRIRWDIHLDHTDEKALFLRIVFRDAALPEDEKTRMKCIAGIVKEIQHRIERKVELEDMGLLNIVYNHVRLESEQAAMKDRDSLENWGPVENARPY